jgi:hypothetical protein
MAEEEQALAIADIYKAYSNDVEVLELDLPDSLLSGDKLEALLSMPLHYIYYFREDMAVDVKNLGVDQLLSYKGYDTRRIFAFSIYGVEYSDSLSKVVIRHAENEDEARRGVDGIISSLLWEIEKVRRCCDNGAEEKGGDI